MKNIKKEMMQVKGGEFSPWYNSLSDKEFSPIIEESVPDDASLAKKERSSEEEKNNVTLKRTFEVKTKIKSPSPLVDSSFSLIFSVHFCRKTFS